MDSRQIDRHFAKQDGVITARQATASGMSTSAIGRRVSTGAWRRLASGVYLRADHPMSPAVTLRIAVFAAGEGACAYGPSAAWWHGLIERPPAATWVTIPRARRVRQSPATHVRRRDLEWVDYETIRSMKVTVLPLAVLEASALVPNGSALLDRALQRYVSLPILRRVHERHARSAGSAVVGAMLAVAAEGGASAAERVQLRLLRSSNLTGWRTHVYACGYELDVAFEKEKVAIEVDGWAWHRDVERFQHDAVRQNALVNAGWHVLRFNWHRLTNDPEGVLREIRAALAARS